MPLPKIWKPRDPNVLEGLEEISSFMGFHPDGRYIRRVHLEGMLEQGAVFILPRKLGQIKHVGFKDRILKYMTLYQRANGSMR
jgi:hypothetical protein